MSVRPPVLRVHAADNIDTNADSLPKRLAGELQDLEASDAVTDVVSAPNPRIVTDTTKEDSPRGTDERWTNQFHRYRNWANRQDHQWDLIGFEKSTNLEDRLYYHIEFPELFFVLVPPDSSDYPDIPWTRTHDLRGIFPAVVAGSEITCADVIEILQGEQEDREWDTDELDITGVKSSGSEIHDNWRDVLINSWETAVDGDWIVHEQELGVAAGDEEGDYGEIDLVMKSADNTEFYLVEIKPEGIKEKVDRAFGQVLRYEDLFIQQRQYQNLGRDDVHLAIAVPSVPSVYHRMGTRYGIEMISIRDTLEPT